MTYSDGKLVVTKKDQTTSSFPIDSIRNSDYDKTTTWNGTAWSHSAPDVSDNAVIDGSYNDKGFSCLNLTVNAGKDFTIASDTQFVAGDLLLKSDAANGTATLIDIGTLTVEGTTQVEQYLTVNRPFWYLSSPLSSSTTTTFTNAEHPNLVLHYNETTSSYSGVLATNTNLAVGKGYVVMLSDTSDGVYTFTGGNVNTGNIMIRATRTGTTALKRGFNLIGNPYP